MVAKVGTGGCAIFQGTEQGQVSAAKEDHLFTTDGIGDCVVLAISGRDANGETGTCFAHLHSYQYLVPALGGRLNRDLPTAQKVVDFVRTHRQDLKCIAATNFDHTLAIRENINARYGLGLKEIKQLNAGGNDGVVTFDSTRFKMYACPPDQISESKDVERLPAMRSATQKDESQFNRSDNRLSRLKAFLGF